MIPPAETLARLKPLPPKMGITRLANVTGLDVIGIPVVMSVRPCSRSLSVSQGKGLDLDSAKVSAAMESVEGYHAERVTGPLELASHDELCQTHSLVDPFRLPLSIVRPLQTSLPHLTGVTESMRALMMPVPVGAIATSQSPACTAAQGSSGSRAAR